MQGSDTFRLVQRRGPQPNTVYELTKEVHSLGRDIANDIVINDAEVSRHHLRFQRGVDGFTIADLGSTNGTFINGQRLVGSRPLNHGDTVSLGETVTLGYERVRTGIPSGSDAPTYAPGPTPPTRPARNLRRRMLHKDGLTRRPICHRPTADMVGSTRSLSSLNIRSSRDTGSSSRTIRRSMPPPVTVSSSPATPRRGRFHPATTMIRMPCVRRNHAVRCAGSRLAVPYCSCSVPASAVSGWSSSTLCACGTACPSCVTSHVYSLTADSTNTATPV
ncbi:MAG: FHA domain-containing protein [Chloroflexi bacterium]|nr:FHA domain-containing protein [Chloroflexota bacterium]